MIFIYCRTILLIYRFYIIVKIVIILDNGKYIFHIFIQNENDLHNIYETQYKIQL